MANNAKHMDKKTDFQKMFHSNHVIMLLIDPDNGKIIDANHAACQFYGYKQKKIIKEINIQDINIQSDSEIKTEMKEALNEKRNNFKFKHMLSSGEIKDVDVYSSKILIDDKEYLFSIIHDITEQKIAEKSLLLSKERAESYLNIAAGIIISLDKKGNISLINDNGSNLLGYKPEELINKNWFEVCIPNSINKKVQHVFNKLMKGEVENVTNFENNVVTKDGIEKIIYWHNTLIYDNENNISGILSSGEDITERKLAELELQKLSTSVEQSPASIVITDIDGNIEYVNPFFEKLTGYSLAEVINQNPRVLQSGLTPQHVFKDLWNTIKRGKVWSGELINKKKNGDIYTESAVIAPIFNEDGVITQYTAVKTDITDRKQAEIALANSQKLYQDLYDKAPDMYFSIDKEDKIISANQNGADYLGYKKTQLIGKKVWMVVHKDDISIVKNQLAKLLLNCKNVAELEFRKVKKDGSIIFVQEYIQCICDNSGNAKELRIVCRDITEINKNKQKILDYQNNLKLMTHELSRIEEREKRELAYKLHDVIGQSMAMAKIKLGEISKNMSFEDVQKNIDMAKSLVVDAIKKSRDLTYELSPPILYELGIIAAIKWYSDQISKLYDIKIQIKGIKESLGCSEEIKIIIYRSIVELLNNIVKYSKASKTVITINKFNNHGRIVVKDNGIGFASKNGDTLTGNKHFGLFSIKERIEYIGGEFKIESKMKVGTTATIKIPTGK